jgi:hypothetical protein
MKIICPMCGEENEYSPAAGCLIKCQHCAEWFGEPTPLESALIACPICTEEINAAVECCPFCSHRLPAQPAVKQPRVASVGLIITGVLLVVLGTGILISAWYNLAADQGGSESLERQALDMERR